ncbi:MAG: trypsin-like serine peptidase [Chloroflexota bacterium]
MLIGWAFAARSGAASVAGASSLRVAETDDVENRTNGKIFGVDPVEGPYTCSGTALDTPSESIVLTAGHCVLENGRWGRDIRFVPAYDHGARPFGTFVTQGVYTMRQWRRSENPDFDVAALRVRPDDLGTLGEVVGGREWTSERSRHAEFEIFGYPAGALHGQSLRACETRGLGSDPLTNAFSGPPTVPGLCDMAGGSSGGAWIVNGRYVDGVTSYGYTHQNTRLYSPYFGTAVGRFLAGLP